MARLGMRGGWFLRAMVLGVVPLIAGCSVPLLGSITLNHIVAVTSATTTAWSGKGLSELALDRVTGKDCRFLDGALREDRDLCEPEGSAATEEDFKGVMTVVNYVRAMQQPEDEGIIVVDGTASASLTSRPRRVSRMRRRQRPAGSYSASDRPLPDPSDPWPPSLRLMPVSYTRDF